jgi:hypothetical protein
MMRHNCSDMGEIKMEEMLAGQIKTKNDLMLIDLCYRFNIYNAKRTIMYYESG